MSISGLQVREKPLLPVLKDATFVSARAGVRPASADDVPIIGPVPGWEGLSVASGHDHAGITLARSDCHGPNRVSNCLGLRRPRQTESRTAGTGFRPFYRAIGLQIACVARERFGVAG
ncbi:MAG: FAD-dependent oxidoreductase [Planctomycetes bacterium]|nr:FAD-dependent oxidoreductase [Planctomycetota bacterium]